jgi:hypothetical protein
MKQLILVGTFLSFAIITAKAQIYLTPTYGAKSMTSVEITKIQITDKYTIVSFYFDSQVDEMSAGWISLSKNMYIKDAKTHKKHYLIKAHNITILPEKINFAGKYQRKFKAYFPSINPATEMIHIIEEPTSEEETLQGFNFYKITLKPVA